MSSKRLDCACEQSLNWATEAGYDCQTLNVIYFYHPDYLGSVEYVTDMRGEPYQPARTAKLGGFFLNTPWGENLENQFAKNYTAFSSRFRFNGKEWDEETGNFYYGARYYDPKISLWLSVDPLAAKYPYVSPYNFVENNPLMLVDPTGMGPGEPEGTCGSTFTSSAIISAVNQDNETVLTNYSVIEQNETQEDGTKLLNRTITTVSNTVKQSDGTVTKGVVKTYAQSGTVDLEGNTVWGEMQLTGQRNQSEEEFKDLNTWTNYISEWNKVNDIPYNDYQKAAGATAMDIVTIGAALPFLVSAPGVKTAKDLIGSLATTSTGTSAAYGLYSVFNMDSPMMLGVSQRFNGLTTLQMRQPPKTITNHSKSGTEFIKWLRGLF